MALKIAKILVLCYAVWAIMLTLLQRRMMFPRHLAQPLPEHAPKPTKLETLWLQTDDGPVEAWFLPGDGVSPDKPGPAVIYAHGNAELIDYQLPLLQGYTKRGISVLLPEFRGYGRSAGSPSQEAITKDYVYFYDQLAGRAEVDENRIVFHGRSLGGGVVCALANERKPAAMVLSSTFANVATIARGYLVPSFLVADPFDNLATITKLDSPLLLVHGTRDRTIPFSHTEALYAARPDATLITYDVDHNNCPPDWPAFLDRVAVFLSEAGI